MSQPRTPFSRKTALSHNSACVAPHFCRQSFTLSAGNTVSIDASNRFPINILKWTDFFLRNVGDWGGVLWFERFYVSSHRRCECVNVRNRKNTYVMERSSTVDNASSSSRYDFTSPSSSIVTKTLVSFIHIPFTMANLFIWPPTFKTRTLSFFLNVAFIFSFVSIFFFNLLWIYIYIRLPIQYKKTKLNLLSMYVSPCWFFERFFLFWIFWFWREMKRRIFSFSEHMLSPPVDLLYWYI